MHDMDCERIALADATPALPTDAELRTAERRWSRAEQCADEARVAYAALLGRALAAFIAEHFPEVVSLDLASGRDDWWCTLRDASGTAYEPSPTANEAYDDLSDQCWEFTAALLPSGGQCLFTLDELHRGDLTVGEV